MRCYKEYKDEKHQILPFGSYVGKGTQNKYNSRQSKKKKMLLDCVGSQ
jgi:hypothetical protein